MNTIDQINTVSFTKAQYAAFTVIDALQGFNSGEQIAGAALVFHLLCERFKQDPREVLNKGHQVLQDSLSFGSGEHVKAIKTYLNKEL
jgi:hypothetical protein